MSYNGQAYLGLRGAAEYIAELTPGAIAYTYLSGLASHLITALTDVELSREK